ncbi:MAG: hypothetical protein ABWX67_08645 [Allosphingosinicella sp.]
MTSETPPQKWKTRFKILSGVVTLAAGLVAIWAFFFPPPPQPPPPPPVIDLTTLQPSNLSIVDATMRTQTHPRTILGFIPVGRDYFNLYDITFKNADGIARGNCDVVAEFSGPKGHRGHGVIVPGHWPDWYENRRSPQFNLPADPSFQQSFFSWPDHDRLALARVRVRIACQKPKLQISPWRDVDLREAHWRD